MFLGKFSAASGLTRIFGFLNEGSYNHMIVLGCFMVENPNVARALLLTILSLGHSVILSEIILKTPSLPNRKS